MSSGVGLGLATPSYALTIAKSVAPEDLGVANGMSATLMNAGVVAGIVGMFALLTDDHTSHRFALVFVMSAAIASLGIIGGLLMTPHDAPQ
jgi:hypothetical protein